MFPGNRGFKVDLRRIDGTPSLYGDDMIDITFQVDYYSDNTMAFAVSEINLLNHSHSNVITMAYFFIQQVLR